LISNTKSNAKVRGIKDESEKVAFKTPQIYHRSDEVGMVSGAAIARPQADRLENSARLQRVRGVGYAREKVTVCLWLWEKDVVRLGEGNVTWERAYILADLAALGPSILSTSSYVCLL
jgi:hypothetical protein